ncbi:MAG: hypothetical protein KDC79_04425 [Cyclobacteriaceae bacterium]|nr:hypothetical protein [Cyclobacteriaceae bacterium]
MKRFIWDFRGRDGHRTAEHHSEHLNGFAEMHGIPAGSFTKGIVQENEFHTYSFMEVDEQYEQKVIDLLLPQRIEEIGS